jgi:hypothetical protein
LITERDTWESFEFLIHRSAWKTHPENFVLTEF